MIQQDVLNLYKKIEKFEKNELNIGKLPSNAYYLDSKHTLILDPSNSGARFPYAVNGFTIWAYASGYISINHSSYYILQANLEGKEPFLDFFGIEHDNREHNPVSILGVCQSYNEIKNKRYTVFTKSAAYYLTKTYDFLYAVVVFLNDNQQVYFTQVVINLSNNTKTVSTSSFFNMLFKYDSNESIETKWFKKVEYLDNMFIYETPEDPDRHTRIENYGIVKRLLSKKPIKIQNTTSRMDYVGSRYGSVRNALSVKKLKFEKAPTITNFTDTSINGDLITFELDSNEAVFISYRIETAHDKVTKDLMINSEFNVEEVISNYETQLNKMSYDFTNYKMEFNHSKIEGLDTEILNQFMKLVNYQVHFSSLSSNSGAIFLGVRDVMQQLESSLIWDRVNVRKKILEVLTFIDPSGLPPRQYSLPPKIGNAKMDLRPFIDQGLWIISTLHTYLAYTEDYKILDEVCGYFERLEPNQAKRSEIKDTVLDHLIRVTEYLISNLDENNNCLKALYGDWNDALDGLGLVQGSSGYGNGVTVMGTLQLYENLERMIEIIKYKDPNSELINKYENIRQLIKEGINNHAIISSEEEKRVLHGWGHNRSYLVGSFNDPDGYNRNSLTSNAFYVISKMIDENPSMKDELLKSFNRLDSKYGLKTFEPAFEDFHGFGRIINLPAGTAENAATYIHATLFGALALYMLGESKFANQQIYKILPQTHEHISTSPFIMSNSYVHNEALNMDGESMSDWYTGSSNTLLKTLIRGLFGLEVYFDTFEVKPAKEFFSKEANLLVTFNNKVLDIKYKEEGNTNRTFKLNGKLLDTKIDPISGLSYVKLNKANLEDNNILEIID